jgi:hypothetical protein
VNALIAWMVITFTAAGRPPAEDVSGRRHDVPRRGRRRIHAFGPYVVEVVAGDVVDMNTIVLPARVGREPRF